MNARSSGKTPTDGIFLQSACREVEYLYGNEISTTVEGIQDIFSALRAFPHRAVAKSEPSSSTIMLGFTKV